MADEQKPKMTLSFAGSCVSTAVVKLSVQDQHCEWVEIPNGGALTLCDPLTFCPDCARADMRPILPYLADPWCGMLSGPLK